MIWSAFGIVWSTFGQHFRDLQVAPNQGQIGASDVVKYPLLTGQDRTCQHLPPSHLGPVDHGGPGDNFNDNSSSPWLSFILYSSVE